MIISEKSWHYKWMVLLGQLIRNPVNKPNTLCGYFWTFIWLNLKSVGYLLVLSFVVSIIPILLYSAFHNHSDVAKRVLVALSITGGILFSMVVIAGICEITSSYFYKKSKEKRYYRSEIKTGFIYLSIQMVKATKNKVCPLITYEK